MALCHNCDEARIEYIGNGTQTDYTFPFEYNERGDVAVANYNEEFVIWEPVTEGWSFLNDTTIRFDEAPASGQKFIIYRCTDLEPLPATFYPGTAIKAQDLNDNFFVLKSAIEEARCALQRLDEKGEEKYWNKIPYEQEPDEDNPDVGETIYSTGEWVCTDDAVASTAAICDKIEEEIDMLKVTEPQQRAGEWIHDGENDDDDHFATTAAITERLDPYFQPQDPPQAPPYQMPGKLWFDNDRVLTSVWDQENRTWVASGLSGPPGPVGPTGTYMTIVSDTAPTRRLDNSPLQNGDVWFNSLTGELYIYYDDGRPVGPRGIQWVQALGGTGLTGQDGPQGEAGPAGHVIVSDTPPTEYPALGQNEGRELEPGDLWFDSHYVMLYVYYEDDAGPGQWVAVSKTGPQGPQGADGGIEEAPEDGEIYGRQDGAWVEIPELLFENPLALDADTQTVSFEIDNLLSI